MRRLSRSREGGLHAPEGGRDYAGGGARAGAVQFAAARVDARRAAGAGYCGGPARRLNNARRGRALCPKILGEYNYLSPAADAPVKSKTPPPCNYRFPDVMISQTDTQITH